MPEALVVAEDFGYRYPESARDALSGVSLELEPGTFTVLAGASGSGKSTLLRALCGLVPHFHGGRVRGTMRIGGLDLRDHGPGELAAVCGTVFQDPETQVVMGGVRAELALPLEHGGEPPGAVARAVEETALALGVAHLLDRRADTLSGGELQRVAIAAALVHRPALVVLDEPTSQLDPVAGDELIWMLRRLNEEWGTAVVIAEHRLERCLPAADRVMALADGAVVCDEPPAGFLAWAAAEATGLATPVARMFDLAGLGPLPASVKDARAALREAGLAPAAGGESAGLHDAGPAPAIGAESAALHDAGPARGAGREDAARCDAAAAPAPARNGARWRLRRRAPAALELRDVWLELDDGPTVLRGLDLRLEPGERVALMGRNGAGKSTLLRIAKGLAEPTRGRVERAGPVALLLQNPGDYLIHERAVEEAGPEGLAAAGLANRPDAHPRDLSGGERQRLALEVALGGGTPAAALLDEPTRGMDRGHKDALAARIERLAADGAAVVVATHDTEFVASFARRVVLMGQGVVIADGPPGEVLGGGRHFSTEVARALDGAALTPEAGAAALRRELVS